MFVIVIFLFIGGCWWLKEGWANYDQDGMEAIIAFGFAVLFFAAACILGILCVVGR